MQNRLYQEIARGSTNKASQYLLLFALSAIAALMGAIQGRRSKPDIKQEAHLTRLVEEKNIEELKRLAADEKNELIDGIVF